MKRLLQYALLQGSVDSISLLNSSIDEGAACRMLTPSHVFPSCTQEGYEVVLIKEMDKRIYSDSMNKSSPL